MAAEPTLAQKTTIRVERVGCIVLRDLAESIQRSFPEISDYSGGKVQRNGCENDS